MSVAAILALSFLLPPQDPEAFAAGLEKVRTQMERRQWDKAYDALRALLSANESAPHALLAGDSIREDMKRIVFWRGRAELDPATLVNGELKKYKDGKLEVIYQGKDLRDWEVRGNYCYFPALFDGPYTVVLKLRSHPNEAPVSMAVGADQSPWVRVSGGLQEPLGKDGRYFPASVDLIRGENDEVTIEENKQTTVMPSKAAEFKLDVTATKIILAHDGKKLLEAKRPKMEYGTFAFFGIPAADRATVEIRISGAVQPAWMQNKIDAALQGARDKFDASYKEDAHLPAWLLESAAAPAGPYSPSSPALRPYPGPELAGDERNAYREAIERLREIEEESGVEGQLAQVASLEEQKDLAPVLLAFLRMRIAEEAGRPSDTLIHADAVRALDDAHLGTQRARARALAWLSRHEEAVKVWDAAVSRFAGNEELVDEYVWYLLDRNQIPRASAVVQAASAANPEIRSNMDELRKRLAMAEKGPAFAKAFEYVSDHYVVQSDISKEICYEAGQMLEKAYTSYSVHLRKVEGLERSRFRVYIFSGEASYHRYTDEAFGRRMENSAGVYSPTVKQLLIWNLPDPADRLRTTVHEGFHQYLDAVTRTAPVWFNEGLAEYYELAETKDGKFQTGQINQDHLDRLKKEKTEPLASFIRFDDAAFRAEGLVSRNYAQAWGFIHFLRHSTRENQAIFDAIFQSLCEGASSGSALRQALEGTSLEDLDAAFLAHLDGLRAK
jgi:hypothetical protein